MDDNNRKIFVTVLSVIMIVLGTVGVTYAVVIWNSRNIKITGSTECLDVYYTKGEAFANANTILFDEKKIISGNKLTIKEGMAFTNVTAYLDSNCNIKANLVINMNVTSLDTAYINGNSVGAFKYAVVSYDPTVYTTISFDTLSGNSFDIVEKGSINSTGVTTLADTPLTTTNSGYLVVLYIDGDLANNDVGETTFNATIDAAAVQVAG